MPEGTVVRIGTRQSPLALAQATGVLRRLQKLHPGQRFELVKIRTTGDVFKGIELFKKNGIGVFTKEIEKALLKRRIDLAVHSLKDLPTSMPPGLILAAVPKRLPANDVLISRKKVSLQTLPQQARVGTGSSRRAAQLLLARPDLRVVPIRGNLDTRVHKAIGGDLDAVVLAQAGLQRLGRYARHIKPIPEKLILPAVGQSALGIQARRGDRRALRLSAALNHSATRACVEAERHFLQVLGGGCRVPVGVSSRLRGGRLYFTGAIFSTRSARQVRGSFSVPAPQGAARARRLARQLLRKGGRALLAESRS